MEDLLFNHMMAGHANKFIDHRPPPNLVLCHQKGNIMQLEEAITQGCTLVCTLERTNMNCKRIIAWAITLMFSPPESLGLYLFWVLETGS